MQTKRKNWILYALLGILVLVAAVAVWKGQSKPKGTAVTIADVEQRTIRETVSASGKIFPETEVKISSDVSVNFGAGAINTLSV
jgi:HlyD family secretion protein